MSRLIVCSEADLPSVNMREALLGLHGDWEDMGSTDSASYLCRGDDVLMSIHDMHIRHEALDREAEDFGVRVDGVIVMSRHSSQSGKPSLTAHPIGNYHEADFGGSPMALSPSWPAGMSDALRRISALNDDPGVQTCFEVTHHGPLLSRPVFFIEIGSDESHWGDRHLADILAHVIDSLDPQEDYPRVVGFGGGHYAPRHSDLALTHKVNVGHMVPLYQTEGRDDDDIARMVRDACEMTGTDQVYIHRKSMKKPEERRMEEIIRSAGFDTPKSADFEPLPGQRRRCVREMGPGCPKDY